MPTLTQMHTEHACRRALIDQTATRTLIPMTTPKWLVSMPGNIAPTVDVNLRRIRGALTHRANRVHHLRCPWPRPTKHMQSKHKSCHPHLQIPLDTKNIERTPNGCHTCRTVLGDAGRSPTTQEHRDMLPTACQTPELAAAPPWRMTDPAAVSSALTSKSPWTGQSSGHRLP